MFCPVNPFVWSLVGHVESTAQSLVVITTYPPGHEMKPTQQQIHQKRPKGEGKEICMSFTSPPTVVKSFPVPYRAPVGCGDSTHVVVWMSPEVGGEQKNAHRNHEFWTKAVSVLGKEGPGRREFSVSVVNELVGFWRTTYPVRSTLIIVAKRLETCFPLGTALMFHYLLFTFNFVCTATCLFHWYMISWYFDILY